MSIGSLPLHVQKAVWGRVLVYQQLDLHQVRLADAGYGLLWSAMRDRLHSSTALQLEFCPAGSLGSYLKQLGIEIREKMSFPDPDAERACIPLLDDIDRVLAEAGRAQEDLLLGAFAHALQAAATLYGEHGIEVSPDLVKRVSVEFDHQFASVKSVLPIELTAVTELHDPRDGPAARVKVRLSPQWLDEDTVFSLPYVLLHECICHVLQGPWQPGRIQADANDRFAEGWMDVVAYTAHQTLSRSGRASTAGPDLLTAPRPTAQVEAAEKVHRARHRRTAHDRAWAQRAMGTQAAHAMTALLEKLPETCAQGASGEAFTRMSLRLNTSTFSNRDRDLFVSRVHKATHGNADAALVPHVREYLVTDELDNLVKGTLQLFT